MAPRGGDHTPDRAGDNASRKKIKNKWAKKMGKT